MHRGIWILGGLILVAAALFARIVPAGRDARAQTIPPAKTHFLEVGKTYTFGWPGGDGFEHGKVLEEPQGDWVKVAIPREFQLKSEVAWVHFTIYPAILPE